MTGRDRDLILNISLFIGQDHFVAIYAKSGEILLFLSFHGVSVGQKFAAVR